MSVELSNDLCAFGPEAANRVPRGRLKARISVAELPRLAEAVDAGGELDVDLEINASTEGTTLVDGQIHATLTRSCQRCLDKVRQKMNIEIHVGVAPPGMVVELPEGYEICEAESLKVGDLLEDEVLLALPMIARHEDPQQCGPVASVLVDEDQECDAESPRRPFAILESMKSN